MEISNTTLAVIGTAIVTVVITTALLFPLLKRRYKSVEENAQEREKEVERLREAAQSLKSKADTLKELADTAESKAELKVKESRTRVADLEKEMQDLHLQMSTLRGKHIEEMAAAKTEAYAKGVKEGIKDFRIECEPYSIDKSNFFKSKHEIGYRYQLLIKGAPAFESKDVKFQEVEKFDEAAQKLLLAFIDKASVGLVDAGLRVVSQKLLAPAKD